MFATGGIALGFLLPLLATWAAELPWIPFQGPIELAASFDQAWLIWVRPLIGLLAGLALAAWVIHDAYVLQVDPERIEVRRRAAVERVIERAKVESVHRRGAKIVIENAAGHALFEGEIEGERAAVRRAFVEAGYPWRAESA